MHDHDDNFFKHYVWELPVRICHWTVAVSIVVLSVTGFFIGRPVSFASSASGYAMGWFRFLHFTFAYLFTISVISRVIWSFIGNKYASWREFLPYMTAEGRVRMLKTLRFYSFFQTTPPEGLGHNPMAATAYLGIFVLYVVMILTGFALFSEYAPHSVMAHLFGFMHHFFSDQGMRFVHHCIMWVLFAFVINHVYSGILMDIKEQTGGISSIFNGYKFGAEKEE